MKAYRNLIVAGLGLLLIAGCTLVSKVLGPEGESVAVHAFTTACDAYGSAFQLALVARQGHLLTPAVIARIDTADAEVAKVCPPGGAMPTSAIDGVYTVVTQTASVLAAIKGGSTP